jgi:hypothetical protein
MISENHVSAPRFISAKNERLFLIYYLRIMGAKMGAISILNSRLVVLTIAPALRKIKKAKGKR